MPLGDLEPHGAPCYVGASLILLRLSPEGHPRTTTYPRLTFLFLLQSNLSDEGSYDFPGPAPANQKSLSLVSERQRLDVVYL